MLKFAPNVLMPSKEMVGTESMHIGALNMNRYFLTNKLGLLYKVVVINLKRSEKPDDLGS